ncbi:hypothetical protein VTK26DRAFT_1462 [Humicola hyalothermophila]
MCQRATNFRNQFKVIILEMPRQHLTPNACLVCRKKRTKCDGQLPCRRCKARGEECAYEDKKWRTKDHLRSEIERLRTEQRQSHALLRALTNHDLAQWETVLNRMRAGEDPDSIAEWILLHSSKRSSGMSTCSSRGVADDEGTPQNRTGPFQEQPALGGNTAHTHPPRRPPSYDPPGSQFPSMPYPLGNANTSVPLPNTPRRWNLLEPDIPGEPIPSTWTKVTSDTALVQRLLACFFSSTLPCLSLVSEPHFMRDFREERPRYCSEALVNAILGLICKAAATSSHRGSRVTFADAFIGEAKALLALEQEPVGLPTIQALAILSLAEMCQGNGSEAIDLARESVRACICLLLRTRHTDQENDDDFRMVRALAFCGSFSLIRGLRLLTGDLEPKTGPLFMRIHPEPEDKEEDAPQARVERGISLQMQFFTELQYLPPLLRFIFEVTEAAHTFSAYHYSKAMTSGDLDGAFTKCLGYYRQVAESGAIDDGPDSLFAKIWYQFCMLSLLRPFVRSSSGLVDGLPPSLSGSSTPGTICRQASKAIIAMASTYWTHYSVAYLPPLLCYILFAAVLYQLSLVINEEFPNQEQQERADSEQTLAPGAVYDPAHSCSETGSTPQFPQMASHPANDSDTTFPTHEVLRKKALVSSSGSARFSSDDPAKRPSSSGFLPATVSDKDGSIPPPETGSGTALSGFSPPPADLVQIGLLQLTSMSYQHPGAAEAVRVLRRQSSSSSSSSERDIAEPGATTATTNINNNYAWAARPGFGPVSPADPNAVFFVPMPSLQVQATVGQDAHASPHAVPCAATPVQASTPRSVPGPLTQPAAPLAAVTPAPPLKTRLAAGPGSSFGT